MINLRSQYQILHLQYLLIQNVLEMGVEVKEERSISIQDTIIRTMVLMALIYTVVILRFNLLVYLKMITLY